MLSSDALAEWSRPPLPDQPYLRPLVCAGDWQRIAVCVAGINPATRIHPTDIGLAEYVRLLLDYSAFQRFYQDLRRDRGESTRSKTRPWIERLSTYVRSKYGHSVAETNVLPLPAKDVKDLYAQPLQAIERAREVFLQLLAAIRPQLILLHGADALREFLLSMRQAGMKHRFPHGNLEKGTLSGKEPLVPYLTLTFSDQGATDHGAQVLVSRHLRMYQFESQAFDTLEARVGRVLEAPNPAV